MCVLPCAMSWGMSCGMGSLCSDSWDARAGCAQE